MRIALVTDAWLPQVNGVTTTLGQCVRELELSGHQVEVVHPGLFRTIPCPRYPGIRLAVGAGGRVRRRLEEIAPQAVHIATEGPLGIAARRTCLRRGAPFTTAFHTHFPHYLRRYAGVPQGLTFALLRRFHGAAARTLVPTPSIRRELGSRGFTSLVPWSRGVDTELFRPGLEAVYDLPRPILVSVGRVAVEKNVETFLALDLPGSKVVVGDGPARASLQRRHPEVHWAGFRFGEELARHYADADLFVFPSLSDTFGVVMLEANASGLPVAAFPVAGPRDVVVDGVTGALDEDLAAACRRALALDRAACRRHAVTLSWRRTAEQLAEALEPVPSGCWR